MCLKREAKAKCIYDKKKGEGTMSAATQNYVYSYGKKQDGKKEPVLTTERLKEIKDSMAKYLTEKKQ